LITITTNIIGQLQLELPIFFGQSYSYGSCFPVSFSYIRSQLKEPEYVLTDDNKFIRFHMLLPTNQTCLAVFKT